MNCVINVEINYLSNYQELEKTLEEVIHYNIPQIERFRNKSCKFHHNIQRKFGNSLRTISEIILKTRLCTDTITYTHILRKLDIGVVLA